MRKVIDNKPQELLSDPYLACHREQLITRKLRAMQTEARLTQNGKMTLADFASGHEYYGLRRTADGWVFREWAPNLKKLFLYGEFNNWRLEPEYEAKRINKHGDWELKIAPGRLLHGMCYKLRSFFADGTDGDRLPSYVRCVMQDPENNQFYAKVFVPKKPYTFRHETPKVDTVLIYESHVGMAQEEGRVGSFEEYRTNILPRIKKAGYTVVQLMAIMSHPYYGSFGYHVANYFSICGLFGTPDEFKHLVDDAHGMGLKVIIDLVHSHAVKNEVEGIARFDGTRTQYFHAGPRGEHPGWDSLLFDYGKDEVLHFLLSNCHFYLDEYHLDGFRFDGVTSMLYTHHGLGKAFTSYDDYFSGETDNDAITYLTLANKMIHQVHPEAITIAEDVSGMPGLAAPVEQCGIGFDYRMAMGVTDMWFKLFDVSDRDWNMYFCYGELANRRHDEKTISYVECHDQAIVGGQTAIFRLVGAEMYTAMNCDSQNLAVERGVALHKMIRLATAGTAGHGYLNFMGNEFGHPEWIDFPREGNGWSYHYSRRQWSLRDKGFLRYSQLGDFDETMLALLKEHHIYDFPLQKVLLRDDDKVIAFERGGLWFFFNFHCEKSYTDYALEAMPGKYHAVLSSDESRFGGFDRIDLKQPFFTTALGTETEKREMLRLYLPCRTALVLQKD